VRYSSLRVSFMRVWRGSELAQGGSHVHDMIQMPHRIGERRFTQYQNLPFH